MAKAKQLPSGSWRVQVYTGRDAKGKAKYLSITCDTEDEANYAALAYRLGKKTAVDNKPENLTLYEAIDRYIEARDAVLSPATVREYRQLQRNSLQGIMQVKLIKITQEMIQREINAEAKTLSPKTIRNRHGLLSAIMREYRPDFILTTKLPQKIKSRIHIPDLDTIQKIIEAADNAPEKELKVPILLAVSLGLRRSEILGLKWSNIDFEKNLITINCAVVLDEDNNQVEKAPKSYAGDRTLLMPDMLREEIKKLPRKGDSPFVVNLTGSMIYKRFQNLLKANNIPQMRFHDLRHVNAAIMLKLNVPNKYAAERMGHATEDMLKNVYQHTLENEMHDISLRVNEFFENNLKKK